MKTRRRKRKDGDKGKIVAEITFSGLCLVRVGDREGSDDAEAPAVPEKGTALPDDIERPRRARDIEVLLVDTLGEEGPCGGHQDGGEYGAGHLHYPRLTYYAEDDLGLHARSDRWDGVLLPSPEGKEVVSVDLSHKRVEIIPPWPYEEEWSELSWCDPPAHRPTSPEEDDRLDWVLQSGQTGLETVEADKAIAVVTGLPHSGKPALPNGEWRTRSVHRNREVRGRRSIRWKIGSITDTRAVARDVILRLRGLSLGVTLRISNRSGDEDPYDIVLTPGGDDHLRFAISNLPQALSEPWDSHLGLFGHLGSGQIVDVVQDDDLVCVGFACDVKVHFEKNGGKR